MEFRAQVRQDQKKIFLSILATVYIFSILRSHGVHQEGPDLSLAYTVWSWPAFDPILRCTTYFEVGLTSSIMVGHLAFSVQKGARANMLLPTHDLIIGWIFDMSEILVSCHWALAQLKQSHEPICWDQSLLFSLCLPQVANRVSECHCNTYKTRKK